jgi:hypothetical protein
MDEKEGSSLSAQAQPSSKVSSNDKSNTQDYVQGLGFFALMILVWIVSTYYLALLHGINLLDLLRQQQTVSAFDFIGGNANAFSIGTEIVYWTLMGVICQMAYQSGRTIIRGQFDFWRSVFSWIGISLYAVGIAIAVIFSLKVVSLNIGDIKITLASAPIEVIIAISFILGFYSEESRRLLGRLRGKIVTGMEAESNEQENDNSIQNRVET